MSNSSCHETDHLHPVMKCAALGAIFHKVKDGHESLAEEVKCVIGMTADIDNAFEDVKGKLTKAGLQTSVDGWVTLQKVRSFDYLQDEFAFTHISFDSDSDSKNLCCCPGSLPRI